MGQWKIVIRRRRSEIDSRSSRRLGWRMEIKSLSVEERSAPKAIKTDEEKDGEKERPR